MDFVIITVLLISLMAAYGYREKSKEKDGIIDNLISQNDNLYTQWEESKKDYKRLLQEKNDIINNHNKEKVSLSEREKEISKRENLFNLKIKDIPVLAQYISDLEFQRDELREAYLLHKKIPAVKAAELLSEIRYEKKFLNRDLKEAEYLIQYYEQAAPWLAECDDDYIDPELNKTGTADFDENKDAASF